MRIFNFFKKKKTETPVETQKFDKVCPHCGAGMMSYEQVCKTCKKGVNDEKVIFTSKVSVDTDYGRIDEKVTYSVPAAGVTKKGSFVRNGLRYTTVEHRDSSGGCWTADEVEYNEVNAFYAFLKKYTSISKPEFMRECDYPHMMFRGVGVNEVKKLHEELSQRGFYVDAPSSQTLSTYKVCEIKEIANKLNLTVKGKKEQLIEQIVAQANESELKDILGSKVQTISQYGYQWMSEHKDEYNYYHSDREWESFEAYKAFWETHDPIKEGIRACKAEIRSDKEQYGRYTYDSLIGYYKEQGGNEREILICYLKELMLDMSGALDYKNWKFCDYEADMIPRFMFTPFLLRTLPGYIDYYDPSMIDEVYELNIPIKLCTKEMFKDIAEMVIEGTLDSDTEKQYQEQLKKNALAFASTKGKGSR